MSKSVYQILVEKHGFSKAQKIIIGLVSGGEILEVGSGAGYMTKEFSKKGCLVDAIEVDEEVAAKVFKFARKAFIGSIEDKNVQKRIKKKYDYIVCADILEHLISPEETLIFLRKHLKKNGYILISIPNMAFWDMRLELLKGRFNYQESGLLDKTHLRFYTYHSFLKLIKETNFKITKIYPAEGRIPFEYTLKKIPLLGKILIYLIDPFLMQTFPNLTYYHYVVQAKI